MSKKVMLFIIACLMLVGCSSKKVSLPGMTIEEGKDGTVTVETKDGSVELAAGDNGSDVKIPEGFPHKLMAGYKAESAMKMTTEGKASYTLALSYTGKTIQEVADYYEAELKALGVEVSRSEMTDSQSGTTILLTGDGPTVGSWVTLTENKDEKQVEVALIYGMK